MQSFSASWPAWPNGVWPRSCASAIASTRSSFRRRLRATERPICATSRLCVSRVRNRSPSWLTKTWVLYSSRRKAVRMDDAVAVALELAARRRRRLGVAPPAPPRGCAAYGREARCRGACARALMACTQAAEGRQQLPRGAWLTNGLPERLEQDELDRAALDLLVVLPSARASARCRGRAPRPAGRRAATSARMRATSAASTRPRRCDRSRRQHHAAATASPCSQRRSPGPASIAWPKVWPKLRMRAQAAFALVLARRRRP